MKTKVFYTLVFLFVTFFSKAEAYQLKYRIECGKSTDKNVFQVINKIPELRKFMMPTGGQIYFSGDYFENYPSAKERLAAVQELGFSKAFIRVFKYRRMLSKQAGDVYIVKIEELLKKDLAMVKDSVETSSAEFSSVQNKKKVVRKTYTKAEIKELKRKRKAKKEALALNKVDSTKSKKKEHELILKKEEIIEEGIVEESPVYKILLGKTGKNDEMPANVESLTDEVVYSYEEGSVKYYAVGFFETDEHAKKRLSHYKKYSTGNPEIIGLYKGRIVSLKLANELHDEYARLHNNSSKL